MKKYMMLLVISCVALMSIGANGVSEGTASAQDETLVVAVQALPITAVHAMAEMSNVSERIFYSVEETLIKTDYLDNGAMKPGLATSWTLLDDRTVEFTLREDVLFHNGEKMTSEDVAFTFGQELLMGDEAPGKAVGGAFLSNIESVEAIDTYTVRITAKSPDALLLTRFANNPTQIISKKAYEQSEGWEAFSKMPVGTGPYKMVEFTDNVRIVIERFDQYWGDNTAAAQRIEFRYVPELSTRIAGLRSGEFDIITEIPPDQASAIDAMKNVKVVGGPVLNIYGMFFDETNSSPMKDKRVREALTLAIDRELLVETLFSNLTTIPQNWQMKVFGDMFLADYPEVPYDPQRAKELLKEANYQGEMIIYRSLPGYYTLEQTVAEAVTQMWQAIGLNVELQIKENWSQITEDNDDRHIINGSFSAYYPDPIGQFERRFGENGGGDGSFWFNSEEFKSLGRQLGTSLDTAERRETFETMLDIFQHDPKGLYLYNLPMIYAISDGVDWEPIPIQAMDFTVQALKGF